VSGTLVDTEAAVQVLQTHISFFLSFSFSIFFFLAGLGFELTTLDLQGKHSTA
jgi:hypothetical protein